jgi:hypothetical protein
MSSTLPRRLELRGALGAADYFEHEAMSDWADACRAANQGFRWTELDQQWPSDSDEGCERLREAYEDAKKLKGLAYSRYAVFCAGYRNDSDKDAAELSERYQRLLRMRQGNLNRRVEEEAAA